jgi:hypothetical protein
MFLIGSIAIFCGAAFRFDRGDKMNMKIRKSRDFGVMDFLTRYGIFYGIDLN